MTFRVTIELSDQEKADLEAMAAVEQVPISKLVLRGAHNVIADLAEFRAAVAEGLADADAGRVSPWEEVEARLRARLAQHSA
ncbi:MAG: hypothetical protein U1E50_00180 [Caulobacteraceae bacterium]|jgi:predicted transcriptional regulator